MLCEWVVWSGGSPSQHLVLRWRWRREWSGGRERRSERTASRLRVSRCSRSAARSISAKAFGPGGRAIPLDVSSGRLTPRSQLAPGEEVTVVVVVRRPSLARLGARAQQDGAADRACARSAADDAVADDRVGACGRVAVCRAGRPSRSGTTADPGRRQEQRVARARARVVRHCRGLERGTFLGAPRHAGAGDVVPGVAPTRRARQSRDVGLDLSERTDSTDVLATAERRARREQASFLARSRRQVAHERQPHLDLRSSRVRLSIRLVASAGVPARVHGRRRERAGDLRPRDRLARRRRELPPPAAAARRSRATCRSSGSRRASRSRDAAQRSSTPRSTRRPGTFTWRYPNTPPELHAPWTPGRAEPDHARRRDDVPARPRARRSTRSPGPTVWHALIADAIAGKQTHRRLQLRLRAPQRAAAADALAQRPGRPDLAGQHRRAGGADAARHLAGVRAHPGRHDERPEPGRFALQRSRGSAGSATSTAARRCTRSTGRRSGRRRASAASSSRSNRRRRCGPTRRSARSSRSRTESGLQRGQRLRPDDPVGRQFHRPLELLHRLRGRRPIRAVHLAGAEPEARERSLQPLRLRADAPGFSVTVGAGTAAAVGVVGVVGVCVVVVAAVVAGVSGFAFPPVNAPATSSTTTIRSATTPPPISSSVRSVSVVGKPVRGSRGGSVSQSSAGARPVPAGVSHQSSGSCPV